MAKKKEKEMIDANGLLDKMIALTFTRHSGVSEDEFLTAIGVDLDKSRGEETEVIYSKFALLVQATREVLRATDKVKLINGTLQLIIGESENGKQN